MSGFVIVKASEVRNPPKRDANARTKLNFPFNKLDVGEGFVLTRKRNEESTDFTRRYDVLRGRASASGNQLGRYFKTAKLDDKRVLVERIY